MNTGNENSAKAQPKFNEDIVSQMSEADVYEFLARVKQRIQAALPKGVTVGWVGTASISDDKLAARIDGSWALGCTVEGLIEEVEKMVPSEEEVRRRKEERMEALRGEIAAIEGSLTA